MNPIWWFYEGDTKVNECLLVVLRGHGIDHMKLTRENTDKTHTVMADTEKEANKILARKNELFGYLTNATNTAVLLDVPAPQKPVINAQSTATGRIQASTPNVTEVSRTAVPSVPPRKIAPVRRVPTIQVKGAEK